MLLAIDIGNTNISLGLFKGQRLRRRYSIATKRSSSVSQQFKNIFSRNKVNDVVICSVVPEETCNLQTALKKFFPKKVRVIGKDIIVPMKNLYRKPSQVGQDRLVNAYAGARLYGNPLIIVDLGTALTFDIISRNREYLGGMILPGFKISLDALADRTALLPLVKLKAPRELIGRSTKSSILSGMVYGFAVLVDNLVKKIQDEIGNDALVVVTGGDINLIKKYCYELERVDPDLTLKGLNLLGQIYISRK
ncbi:type III pantothenate kinase [bacterium]|nr:MAG: type III pantothenate kinase [bacterium]